MASHCGRRATKMATIMPVRKASPQAASQRPMNRSATWVPSGAPRQAEALLPLMAESDDEAAIQRAVAQATAVGLPELRLGRFLQEALRRGVWLRPIGADVYVMPPYCITAGELDHLLDQAVACAKAAGRMLAVLATGDEPEIAPVIAKPLAMMAITETYQAFWMGY